MCHGMMKKFPYKMAWNWTLSPAIQQSRAWTRNFGVALEVRVLCGPVTSLQELAMLLQ
jgi:hypothetical protein